MVDVRGGVLRPPHCTTTAAVKSNKNQKWDPWRAMKTFIRKKVGHTTYFRLIKPHQWPCNHPATKTRGNIVQLWRSSQIDLFLMNIYEHGVPHSANETVRNIWQFGNDIALRRKKSVAIFFSLKKETQLKFRYWLILHSMKCMTCSQILLTCDPQYVFL